MVILLLPGLTAISTRVAVDATAAGEQGIIDWQPSGAHGNLHGAGSSGALGAVAFTSAAVWLTFMFMPDIVTSVVPGLSQAKPLVTTTRPTRNKLDKSAISREGRCIMLTIS